MRCFRSGLCAVLVGASVRGLAAQATAAPVRVPLRALPPSTATSQEGFGSLASLLQLPNGNVLVNDQARRQVVLLDSTLRSVAIMIDSAAGRANSYGSRPGALIPFRGDSSLFLDPVALSMIVLDPAGKIARVMAAPVGPNFIPNSTLGFAAVDSRGRLVYRGADVPRGGFVGRGSAPTPRTGARVAPSGPPSGAPAAADTAPLVAFDLVTRRLDTVAFYRISRVSLGMRQTPDGETRMVLTTDPLPLVDAWAVMSDGTIAILRGREYRVEFVDGSGKHSLSDKIPHEWQHLSDADKGAYLDSARAAVERQRARELEQAKAAAAAAGETLAITPSGDPRGVTTPPPSFFPASDLPDYKPAFGPGGVRADADDHLWVRTIPTTQVTGGPIYDVVDRDGKLVQRFQLPPGSTIAGFGAGGIVYIATRDATGTHIQRARVSW